MTSAGDARNYAIPQYHYARDCGSGTNDSLGPECSSAQTPRLLRLLKYVSGILRFPLGIVNTAGPCAYEKQDRSALLFHPIIAHYTDEFRGDGLVSSLVVFCQFSIFPSYTRLTYRTHYVQY